VKWWVAHNAGMGRQGMHREFW